MRGTVKPFRHLLRENILVETEVSSDVLPIEGDSGKLEQVLINLAVNARDAMLEGGRLVMRIRAAGILRFR